MQYRLEEGSKQSYMENIMEEDHMVEDIEKFIVSSCTTGKAPMMLGYMV